MLETADLTALWITLKLAFLSTSVLLLLGTPVGWWLARTRSRARPMVEALVALPLACGEEAQSIIDCTVTGHDRDFELTQLAFVGGTFTVPGNSLAPGTPVRLRILARDVSLTLERQTGTSILNIIPTSLQAVAAHGAAQATVRLHAGGVPLLSRITRKSAAALDLEPGRRLYAQVKSIAVLA